MTYIAAKAVGNPASSKLLMLSRLFVARRIFRLFPTLDVFTSVVTRVIACAAFLLTFNLAHAADTQPQDTSAASSLAVVSSNLLASESAPEVLLRALNQWANQGKAHIESEPALFNFSVNDKRLAIPDCSNFSVDPKNRINQSAIPRTFAVEVRCDNANWQRRIRGRRNVPEHHVKNEAVELASVQVFSPKRVIKKGEVIRLADLNFKQSLEHRTPQNAVTEIKGPQRYAARNLMPGRLLVASDLVIGQRVAVLAQAVPARSPVSTDNVVIEVRAVDVPHDAIRSLQGLSLLAANRLLHPGDILRKRDLTKAKLVKRGQKVAVESTGRHYRIASELIALEDGYLGEQIELRNPGSNRQISAIVTGMGTARSGKSR